MSHQRKWLLTIFSGGMVLVLFGLGAWQGTRGYEQSVAAAYRRKMRDPVYRMTQTIKLHPCVEQEILAEYPHAKIVPYRHAVSGKKVYEVHLPPEEARLLPLLFADLWRVAGKYRKQGYQGTLLLYDGDRIIRSVQML